MSELDLIIERVESQGRRVTSSRQRVLEAVLDSPAHFTVDDVLRRTPDVGRATVFRTMKLLQDMGLVCRILMEDGALHYRLGAHGHHHHLVCRSCGRVEDFTTCDVSAIVGRLAEETDYRIEGHWLEVYGRCRGCRTGEAAAAG
jgi:Fur family ferric uptake transcriptional regulator